MTKLVRILDECYTELEQMRKEIIENKKKQGIRGKTSFGEVICRLIRERVTL